MGARHTNRTGVNAVALRQATNWGSRYAACTFASLECASKVSQTSPTDPSAASRRIGVARAAEQAIKEFKGKKKSDALSPGEKVIASAVGAPRLAPQPQLLS